MLYRQFNTRELYCMAQLCNKAALFGIPDGFEMLAEEEIPQARMETLDDLLAKQITTMDLDGNTILDEAYLPMMEEICDCETCLTVNYQSGTERSEDVVFWRTGNRFLRADVMGNNFVFLSDDEDGIKSYLSTLSMPGCNEAGTTAVTIPQIALAKAKRAFANRDEEGAKRTLMQNGSGALTDAISEALQENADYLGLLVIRNLQEESQMQQAGFLSSNGCLLSLSDDVVNYRNCTVFSRCTTGAVSAKIQELSLQFFGDAKESSQ